MAPEISFEYGVLSADSQEKNQRRSVLRVVNGGEKLPPLPNYLHHKPVISFE
ncbi:MAG: hypothetical protein ACI9YL_001271 [Luteibaculaceae bacterium]|jgi:hypothetical protein